MTINVVLDNPSEEELKEAGQGVYETGTSVRNSRKGSNHLGAIETKICWTARDFSKCNSELARVFEYMRQNPMIKMDRVLQGREPYKCRLFVSARFPHIAGWWGRMLDTCDFDVPDSVTYCISDWPKKCVYVFPKCPDNPYGFPITIILGSDYPDEVRISFLRQFMYEAKSRKDALGLHVASKIIRVRGSDGNLQDCGVLLFGAGNTDKASLWIHDHGLVSPERTVLKQYGIVSLAMNGYALGAERKIFSPQAGLGGDSFEISDNSYVEGEIDSYRVDKIFFITPRNDILPPIVKLSSPEWGSLAFMLGESDKERVAGFNPFMIGNVAEEGNIFLRTLKANKHMQCYILNTGSIGGKEDISLDESALIMRREVEGLIKWKHNKYWGYLEPYEIAGVDMDRFNPGKFYRSQKMAGMNYSLRQERRQWLKQFEGKLAKEVVGLLD